MLMDLSKDIMMDLGITVVGDIIAILKHAKLVHRQVSSDFQSVMHFIGDSMYKILLWHFIAQYVRVRFPLLAGHMRLSLPNLSAFFRTCVKWLRKPSPQDRPVLKLSLEELPTLVSVDISFPFLILYSFLSSLKEKKKISSSKPVQLHVFLFSCSAATRMIANALSNDSPPATPARRPDNRLSVTVSNVQLNKSTKAGRYRRNV